MGVNIIQGNSQPSWPHWFRPMQYDNAYFYTTTSYTYTSQVDGLWAARGHPIVQLTTVDTLTTVCDVSGSGFLCYALGPYNNVATTYTIRVTIDGYVVEWVVTSRNGAHLNVHGNQAYGGSMHVPEPANMDYLYINNHYYTYPPITMIQGLNKAMGVPTEQNVIRFQHHMKYEISASALNGTANNTKVSVVWAPDIHTVINT